MNTCYIDFLVVIERLYEMRNIAHVQIPESSSALHALGNRFAIKLSPPDSLIYKLSGFF